MTKTSSQLNASVLTTEQPKNKKNKKIPCSLSMLFTYLLSLVEFVAVLWCRHLFQQKKNKNAAK